MASWIATPVRTGCDSRAELSVCELGVMPRWPSGRSRQDGGSMSGKPAAPGRVERPDHLAHSSMSKKLPFQGGKPGASPGWVISLLGYDVVMKTKVLVFVTVAMTSFVYCALTRPPRESSRATPSWTCVCNRGIAQVGTGSAAHRAQPTCFEPSLWRR